MARLEAEARENKKGLWAAPNPINPYEWWKREREKDDLGYYVRLNHRNFQQKPFLLGPV